MARDSDGSLPAKLDQFDLKVFISHRDSVCDECRGRLGPHAWITLAQERGALCLSCADLDHLVFLPAGEPALTRRARRHSVLAAVVLKWSRARKRYERQGLLVQEDALQRAEEECLADAEIRIRRQEREAARRREHDLGYIEEFARRIAQVFPSCPDERAQAIAEHACEKYSGRVGRSSAARRFDEEAIGFAVRAHLRHAETNYDALLAKGVDRGEARSRVRDRVDRLLEAWRR
ncbi:MAG TPA: DUF2293 domain-containing protein [Vicinamibacterales bacterium]|jgi:hypothetical protein